MTHLNLELIESLFGASLDDRTRQLLHLLAQDQGGEAAGDEEPDDRALDNRPHRDPRWSARRRSLERLGTELRELRHRNGRLAQALGACPNCWGETEECEDCQGTGRPGAWVLDRELFEAVVVPAVRRHDADGRPRHGGTQDHPHTPQEGGSQP